ncbi:glycosyltransferase family 4 protein [Ochrobactrum teleogrylli]|uniref:Glycosyltransferase family 4 protein n=1 Tax=Ochrobactrum teleogrylli TaxID=2479765 RepID=A0ABY2Y112_9HYPH|nr:glycosyltransferase family 4 protein [[Ochrobactrum] teleogrylli]TNV09771.1 glycosyltransferase family 4 protein [[Ochrobactrum] teleogrylli]
MRILIVSQYFWPESFVINDLALSLARQGHKITVVTGKPNYPSGQIADGYTLSGIDRDVFAGCVEVIRVPIRPRGRAGAIALSLNYLSFVVSGLLRFPSLLRGRAFDAVLFFGVSPLTAAIPATVIARQKKAHLALWIQDIWPESLSATGFVNSRLALWLVGRMMRMIYSQADTLLLQSAAFEQPVAEHADREKFVYFPNPAPAVENVDHLLPLELEVNFQDCFPIVFAGNLGRAQSIETILEAACHLRDHPQIRFVIIGTGSEADRLRQLIVSRGLHNICMTGQVERSLMPAVFQRAGALLVTLKNEPVLRTVVPSKVQAYMQAGKPIVGALNGEGANIIKTAGCGLVVEAEDGLGLVKSIMTLYSMPEQKRVEIGLAGRQYFETHFEAGNAAIRLIKILETRIGARQSD